VKSFEPGGFLGPPLLIDAAAAFFTLVWFLVPHEEDHATASVGIRLAPDGSHVVLVTPPAKAPDLKVSALMGDKAVAMFGQVARTDRDLTFTPAALFLSGQTYRAEWINAFGVAQQTDFSLQPQASQGPTVQMRPQSVLPANALKFYLHFSEPMEQGIFLDRLRLLDADGKEIVGPFRETELWSPDGKRLTVWFHPGRQKTGVNLNTDEGPVLRAAMKHALVVVGSWRNTSGVALGKDVRFDFQVGEADHAQPNMKGWQITAPKSSTREALVVRFDEPMDTAVAASALRVKSGGNEVALSDAQVSPDGLQWSATPQQPWLVGTLELHAEPTLEDLAGNSLEKLFEVDVSQAVSTAPVITHRSFEVR
jgi:hypothetical protein